MSTEARGALRICPLGGLGEVGMNCLALEQRGWVLLVDCGVTFDHRGLGVDVIYPDFSALEPFRGRIAGVFVRAGSANGIALARGVAKVYRSRFGRSRCAAATLRRAPYFAPVSSRRRAAGRESAW
jgi:mRNA degradation ribonuclease J1/J2